MKTRSRKGEGQENVPALSVTKTPGKPSTNKVRPESSPQLRASSHKKRSVLKEKTNLNVTKSPLRRCCKKSPIKEIKRCENLVQRNASDDSHIPSKENILGTTSSTINSDVDSFRSRKCIYMASIPEEAETVDKSAVYEYVVDKSEPPSRRRRMRAKKQAVRKPRVCPRKRVHSASEDSVASSCATSSFATKSSVGPHVSFKDDLRQLDFEDHPILQPCSPIHEVDVDLSPLPSAKTPPTPRTVIANMPAKNTTSEPECPSSIRNFFATLKKPEYPIAENIPNHPYKTSESPSCSVHSYSAPAPPPTADRSSQHNSSVWSEGHPVYFNTAKHHSTPCKARSGSDTSSFASKVEDQSSYKENCFGFSSDEEEEKENAIDLPSPVHFSPYSHAQRQTMLLSPVNAPSRFSPEVLKKALALEAAARPLDASRVRRKLKNFDERKAEVLNPVVKNVRKKAHTARAAGARKPPCNMTKRVTKEEPQLESPLSALNPVIEPINLTPPGTDGLFAELDGPDDKPLKVRPPRRSYERPLVPRSKKVVGGGLCLESEDEETEINAKETDKIQSGRSSPTLQKRKPKNTGKKEKEVEDWATQMKMKFDEVEDFDLCVG